MIDQTQSELLPLTIRSRIEAAVRRFQEREDRKAQERLANLPASTSQPETAQHDREVTG